MGRTKKGMKNGTGPYKDSYQRKKTGKRGKRKLKGIRCPKS